MLWKVLVGVGESYEYIIFVEGRLVHAPYGPLAGPFETAPYTLTTGHIEGQTILRGPFEGQRGTNGFLVPPDWVVARQRRIPPRIGWVV